MQPKAYYNEHDPKAAAWLRELIKAGLIAPGDVDTRDIQDVKPHELIGYTQQHFFAGIGGWSLALRLAGWPDSRPVRTGSCPCQPFSAAGKQLGEADARHLWPVFRDLITFGEPTATFGEQVASAAGRVWLARVRADLEGLGYAVGAADLCSAGVGAPNIRQRLYWVANPKGYRLSRRNSGSRDEDGRAGSWANAERCVASSRMADGDGKRFSRRPEPDQRAVQSELDASRRFDAVRCGDAGGVGDANGSGLGEQRRAVAVSAEQSAAQLRGHLGFWSAYELLACTDGKSRRIEPGSFPLAHGVPGRVGLLRGYGNAINPEVAAEFIRAAIESGVS